MTLTEPNLPYQTQIDGETELERLVSRSRLIGADATLVVHGGGNTSSKIEEIDHLGRSRTVLRIKGSGADLKTISASDFPGLFLDELLPLRHRSAMSDEEMVEYLGHCMVEPGARRPSIETLLHAFLPARHVDHVHADAVCALTNTPDAERHVRNALGPDVAVVPYIRPGFTLSRQVAEFASSGGVVLAKHGLVTWGDSHEESYGRTIELVARANDYLRGRGKTLVSKKADFDQPTTSAFLLRLRGLLSGEGKRVLYVDRSQRALADRADAAFVATAARATPDHILRIGAQSLFVDDPEAITDSVGSFAERYRAYVSRHAERLPTGLSMLSPLPRTVLVPGLGCVAAGSNPKIARMNAEIAARSHLVTARVLDAFGEVDWLSEEDIFDFDYWPLELHKLLTAPASAEFSGAVVVITGGGSELGNAVASRFAREGAQTIVEGNDLFETAIASHGGIDVLVALQPASSGELKRVGEIFALQGLGGAIVGLETPTGATINLQMDYGDQVRANLVGLFPDAADSLVAEVIAFLASSRSAGTTRATIPVTAY